MFELHRAEWRAVGSECDTRRLLLPEVSLNLNLNSTRLPVRWSAYTATSVKASMKLVVQYETLCCEEGDVCTLFVYSWVFVRMLGVPVNAWRLMWCFEGVKSGFGITWNCNCVGNKHLSGSVEVRAVEKWCDLIITEVICRVIILIYISSAWLRFTYVQVTHREKTTLSAVIVSSRFSTSH